MKKHICAAFCLYTLNLVARRKRYMRLYIYPTRWQNRPEPTESQRKMIELLRDDRRAKDAYLEALYALQQDEYPGRMVHFAHSLREVIDHLARRGQTERDLAKVHQVERKKSRPGASCRTCRAGAFRGFFRPKGWPRFTNSLAGWRIIARQCRSSAPARRYQRLRKRCIRCSGSSSEINLEIDDILQKPPSLSLAERLVSLQRRRLQTQSHLAGKLPVGWLKHMNKAGFFENPPPASEDEYRRWAPAIYLQRCGKGVRGRCRRHNRVVRVQSRAKSRTLRYAWTFFCAPPTWRQAWKK